ncbi:AraC family transcriptional regulator [Flavobacterium pectinovorum]|uniref:AraC family transcriptional regulator n=1 Tax=Flavobacterium pectinovorum TaxID=29533 RepID=UPI001FABBB75|nr:helix-turn-helix domain-containing protein [Flavobacterium pectinovorum]MCI9845526.1 helix-turn-helix domain-containing protein [Flavobacterium pectinovorum]
MAKSSRVQNYSLWDILHILGEEISTGAEFHIHFNKEPIVESPFPYPFQSTNTGILLMISGKMKVQVNFETFIVSPNDILIISPHSIINFLEVIEPVQNIGIVFTEEFALRNILNYQDVRLLRFIELQDTPVLSLSESNFLIVFDLLKKMHKFNVGEDGFTYYKDEKIFHYFNLVALEIMDIYRDQVNKVDLRTNRKKEIIKDFLSLLSIHVRDKRNVQFYADKLFITPGHLSKLLKEVSGNTSREVIEEAVVMEARNMLVDSSLSLAEIAEKLNFSDPSFFGKFFKKKMKITPKAFRDKYK